MAAAVAHPAGNSPSSAAHTPSHTHHYGQHVPHHTHFHYVNERTSPSPASGAAANHFTPPRLLPQTVVSTGPAHNVIQIRTVQKPIEHIMVDGENPFRPEGDLYKEAEQEIQPYIRPLSPAPVTPVPEDIHLDPQELDREFPLLINHHPHEDHEHVHHKPTSPTTTTQTQVREDKERSKSSSSAGSVPHRDTQTNIEEKIEQKENIPPKEIPTVVRDDEVIVHPGRGKETHRDEPETTTRPKPEVPEKESPQRENGKGKKKKRKVGCGGDKSCSIM